MKDQNKKKGVRGGGRFLPLKAPLKAYRVHGVVLKHVSGFFFGLTYVPLWYRRGGSYMCTWPLLCYRYVFTAASFMIYALFRMRGGRTSSGVPLYKTFRPCPLGWLTMAPVRWEGARESLGVDHDTDIEAHARHLQEKWRTKGHHDHNPETSTRTRARIQRVQDTYRLAGGCYERPQRLRQRRSTCRCATIKCSRAWERTPSQPRHERIQTVQSIPLTHEDAIRCGWESIKKRVRCSLGSRQHTYQ